mmetsp:Transcript_11334/g.32836  ORF Transcript_11334/g.32836 Transcript_11334/m.32836 type:complete len:190 (-) Transcript_11334:1944-2513(-)
MGNLSSCCSVEPTDVGQNRDRVFLPPNDTQGNRFGYADNGTAQGSHHATNGMNGSPTGGPGEGAEAAAFTPELEAFQRKLQDGLRVTVILQDGTSLLCTVSLDVDDLTFTISFQEKTRKVAIRDIKALLVSRQLKRVETRASIVDDPRQVHTHALRAGRHIHNGWAGWLAHASQPGGAAELRQAMQWRL